MNTKKEVLFKSHTLTFLPYPFISAIKFSDSTENYITCFEYMVEKGVARMGFCRPNSLMRDSVQWISKSNQHQFLSFLKVNAIPPPNVRRGASVFSPGIWAESVTSLTIWLK